MKEPPRKDDFGAGFARKRSIDTRRQYRETQTSAKTPEYNGRGRDRERYHSFDRYSSKRLPSRSRSRDRAVRHCKLSSNQYSQKHPVSLSPQRSRRRSHTPPDRDRGRDYNRGSRSSSKETRRGNTVPKVPEKPKRLSQERSSRDEDSLSRDPNKSEDREDKDEDLEPSFRDVITWVREFFEMGEASDSRYVFQGSIGDRATRQQKAECPSLKPASVFQEENDNLTQVIKGKAPLFKKVAKPYPRAAYLGDPPFSKTVYQVDGWEQPTNTPLTPGNWDSLARPGSSKKEHTVKLSETEAKGTESHLSKMKSILNLADWSTGFIVQHLGKLVEDPKQLSDELTVQLLRVARTVARSISHLQREVIHLHANMLLRRRDAYLADLPSEVSRDDVLQLRASSFQGQHLFDPAVVSEAITRSDATISRGVQLKVIGIKGKGDDRKPAQKNRSSGRQQQSNFTIPKVPRPSQSASTSKQDQPQESNFQKKDFSYKSSARGGRGRGRRQ